MNWTSGPADSSLGVVAQIRIPAGYKFTGPDGAGRLLPRQQKAEANKVLGALAPESGGWVVFFEYSGIGHVREAQLASLEAGNVLKDVQAQVLRGKRLKGESPQEAGLMLSWALAPVYDAGSHTLEWALAANRGSDSAASIHHTVRLLGRRGVLDVVALMPAKSGLAAVPLKEMAATVSFREGEAYGDYREGDSIFSAGPAVMISESSSLSEDENAFAAGQGTSGRGTLVWVGTVGSGLAAGAIILLALTKRPRRPKTAETPRSNPEPKVAAANGEATAFAATEPGSRPAAATKATNHHHHRRGSRRRKEVDYTKFFMDLRSAVSDHSSYIEPEAVNEYNGYQLDDERLASSPPEPPPSVGRPARHILDANADLLANQKNLIEEQRRLIQEQTKLIEEKNKLVREQNQLLARQAELIDERLLPS